MKQFLKTWLIAVRPFAYTASALTVLLGVAIARYVGAEMRWGLAALTLIGVMCFQSAANLINDAFDHRRGVDVEVNPVSGAVVRGLLTEQQALRGGIVFVAVGVAIGLCIVSQVGWVILAIGVFGTLCTITYTLPGLCLKYAGLGDLAVFLGLGVVPVFGAFYVQARAFHWLPVLWGVPLAMLTIAILHANNWRDIRADTAKGCRTVAATLGDRGSAVYYAVLVFGPAALVLVYFALGLASPAVLRAPATVFIGLLAIPLAVKLMRDSHARLADPPGVPFLALDGHTARFHMVFGALLTLAFLVGGRLPA